MGDQLGSKLVHLGIRAGSYNDIQSLDFLSNQMFKFSSLKKLTLRIESKDFDPSLWKIDLICLLFNLIRWSFHANSIGVFEMQLSLLSKFLFLLCLKLFDL